MVGHSYGWYIDSLVFGGTGKLVFVLPVIFLGLGGLLRERAHHTAAFTLALPVSRAQFVGSQIAVGLAELGFLALLPALLIQPLSAMVRQSYPMAEALRYSLLRFICGILIFGISFLLSVVMRGEYAAPMACWVALLVQAQVAAWGPLRPYRMNPLRTMDGHWAWAGSTVNDPIPWMGLSIMMLIALALFAAATRITQRQNL
jgi:ABC-type transport system involved in multi-copper enzyme maturation permease subunit